MLHLDVTSERDVSFTDRISVQVRESDFQLPVAVEDFPVSTGYNHYPFLGLRVWLI